MGNGEEKEEEEEEDTDVDFMICSKLLFLTKANGCVL